MTVAIACKADTRPSGAFSRSLAFHWRNSATATDSCDDRRSRMGTYASRSSLQSLRIFQRRFSGSFATRSRSDPSALRNKRQDTKLSRKPLDSQPYSPKHSFRNSTGPNLYINLKTLDTETLKNQTQALRALPTPNMYAKALKGWLLGFGSRGKLRYRSKTRPSFQVSRSRV